MKPVISDFNCETQEYFEREMTDEEYAQHLLDVQEFEDKQIQQAQVDE